MPGSCWASTSLGLCADEDVGSRDETGHNVLEWSASSLLFSVDPRASGDPAKRAASEIKQAWVPACAGTNGCKALRAHRRSVMRGLGPYIHVFGALHGMNVDGRDKPCAQGGEAGPEGRPTRSGMFTL